MQYAPAAAPAAKAAADAAAICHVSRILSCPLRRPADVDDEQPGSCCNGSPATRDGRYE